MKLKTLILLAFIGFLFGTCKNEPKYEKSDKGFDYRIIFKNKEGKEIKNSDLISLKLKFYTKNDSLLFDSEKLPGDFRVKISNSKADGLMQDALKMLKTGDSASFLIPAKDFYLKTKKDSVPDFMSDEEQIRFEVKINEKISEERLRKEYNLYLLKKEAEEKQKLREFISAESISVKPEKSGIYIIKLKNGNGRKAEKGKKVTINFTGKLINGKIFDSSINKGKPLTFVLGNEYVIPAWNEAIEKMREGDKILLIAPSETAYGKEGLENYVPPFSTLIYEIKLLKVK